MVAKRELPTWSIVAALAAVLLLVALLFIKGGASAGEASKDELTQIRMNQRSFSAGGPANGGVAHK